LELNLTHFFNLRQLAVLETGFLLDIEVLKYGNNKTLKGMGFLVKL